MPMLTSMPLTSVPIASVPRSLRLLLPLLATTAIATGLTACSSDSSSGPSIAVTADDSACTAAKTSVTAGPVTFAVTNKGSKTTEVYLYAKTGNAFTKVVGEAEDIGPGTSREFAADLDAGTFELACKPGQQGQGIRTTLTVTGS